MRATCSEIRRGSVMTGGPRDSGLGSRSAESWSIPSSGLCPASDVPHEGEGIEGGSHFRRDILAQLDDFASALAALLHRGGAIARAFEGLRAQGVEAVEPLVPARAL